MASGRNKMVKAGLVVEVVFGTAFQRDFGMRVLRALLQAWQQDIEQRHRDTRLCIMEHGVNYPVNERK